MSALTVSHAAQASTEANAWLTQHHEELCSRAGASFARLDPGRREEAVAEVIALVADSAHRAAERGTLARITAYHAVTYASRQVRCGRRATGTSSTDVLAEATQRKRDIRVLSLDAELDVQDPSFCLRETLAGRDSEDPGEVVRRCHDYPFMLNQKSVSAKARATFRFLAETHGEGKQADLAMELRVTPGRIVQLKRELEQALAAHGYHGPLGQRPGTD